MGITALVKAEFNRPGHNLLFTEEGVAIVLGIDPVYLRGLRVNGIGPKPYREFFATAWYRKAEVEIYRNRYLRDNWCNSGGSDLAERNARVCGGSQQGS